ncbi:MAG TPA: phosphosulfolactate synthase [Hyphomicrobiaceae bacterium]
MQTGRATAGKDREEPFSFVELPATRTRKKPRRFGLTMMADFGLTREQTESVLGLSGDFMDFAKIAVGTARLYSRSYLTSKLDLYTRHAVRPFIGGQFAEYVLATQGRQALPRFFEEAVALGFTTIEISDNCVPLTEVERRDIIREAAAGGLSVFGEVGSKDRKSTASELVEQAGVCFAAGSELVLVEAAEFVDQGRLDEDLIGAVTGRLDMTRVMIELPGPWISGVTLAQVYDMRKLLIKAFGPDVNIANVKPDDVFDTEALRVGLGVVGPTLRSTPEEGE